MAVEAYNAIRDEVRNDFRDTLGTMFGDDDLDRFIDESQREYCLATGCLNARSQVVVPYGGGPIAAPADFVRPVRLLGVDSREIPECGSQYLVERFGDFRMVGGDCPRAVVWDFDSWGWFRIFPTLPMGTVAGTLVYQRLPRQGEVEVRDADALREYTLYQMYIFSGKANAMPHLSRFQDAVNEFRAGNRKLYARPQTRSSNYF